MGIEYEIYVTPPMLCLVYFFKSPNWYTVYKRVMIIELYREVLNLLAFFINLG